MKGTGIKDRSNSQKTKSFPKGLTLIEILIVLLISSIVMLALLSLYSAGQKYFHNQGAKADTIEDSRYPLTWISRDIREAVQVIPSGTFDGESYATSTWCLVLEVPSINEAGDHIDYTSIFDTIIYWQNPEFLNRFERIIKPHIQSSRPESLRLLADNIGNFQLSFFDLDGNPVGSYTDSAIVEIILTSTKSGIGRSFQETLNTRVKLRNKAVS